jgi:hypothetical protein
VCAGIGISMERLHALNRPLRAASHDGNIWRWLPVVDRQGRLSIYPPASTEHYGPILSYSNIEFSDTTSR